MSDTRTADLGSNHEHANRADQDHRGRGEPEPQQTAIANVPKSLRKDDIFSTMYVEWLLLVALFKLKPKLKLKLA